MNRGGKRVGIIGLGYVGLTLALALSRRGMSVYGAEIDKKRREDIASGKTPFFEYGLERFMRTELQSGNLSVVERVPNDCDSYIICVSTPFDKTKSEPNLDILRNASQELAQGLHEGALVINRATVPIGATRSIMLPELEKSGMRCGIDFDLAFAPERTLEGKAMEELFSNTQIIGGYSEQGSDRAAELFRHITPTIVNVSSLEAAEAIKLLDNTYRDVTFGFANSFAGMCETKQLDAHEIITAANTHYPRNRIPVPSPGVGGTCLTKDPNILMWSCPDADTGIVKASRALNESVPERMVGRIYNKLSEIGGETNNSKFYLVGFAFKGSPITDDMRDSTSLWFLDALRKRTNSIFGYDPVVKEDVLRSHGVEVVENYADGFEKADAVVVLNNHTSYRNWDLSLLTQRMHSPGVIFDSWRMLEVPRDMERKGVHYMSVGK